MLSRVKRGKNNAADAEAICEAVTRPTMRFVPVKTPEQQSVMMLHRVRFALSGGPSTLMDFDSGPRGELLQVSLGRRHRVHLESLCLGILNLPDQEIQCLGHRCHVQEARLVVHGCLLSRASCGSSVNWAGRITPFAYSSGAWPITPTGQAPKGFHAE